MQLFDFQKLEIDMKITNIAWNILIILLQRITYLLLLVFRFMQFLFANAQYITQNVYQQKSYRYGFFALIWMYIITARAQYTFLVKPTKKAWMQESWTTDLQFR